MNEGEDPPDNYVPDQIGDELQRLESENAALKAEVKRLTTWVTIDVEALPNGGTPSARLWAVQSGCICVASDRASLPVLCRKGNSVILFRETVYRYLPIALPEGEK